MEFHKFMVCENKKIQIENKEKNVRIIKMKIKKIWRKI
jgi:hypothetical protein